VMNGKTASGGMGKLNRSSAFCTVGSSITSARAGERTDYLIGFGAPLRQCFEHPDDPPGPRRAECEVFFCDALAPGFNYVVATQCGVNQARADLRL
jgi:hypothetical protein